jgi:hypothetical protein
MYQKLTLSSFNPAVTIQLTTELKNISRPLISDFSAGDPVTVVYMTNQFVLHQGNDQLYLGKAENIPNFLQSNGCQDL